MIYERVKILRKQLGLSQELFGRKLGVTRGVIKNIELNIVPPKDAFIELACKIYNANREWLENGCGDMFNLSAQPEMVLDELWSVFSGLKPDFQEYIVNQVKQLREIQDKGN